MDNGLRSVNDFFFIGETLHAKVGTPRQHFALMIACHPDIANFARWPVIFVDEIKLKAAPLRFLQARAKRVEPFLRQIWCFKAISCVQKGAIDMLVHHATYLFLHLGAFEFAVPKPERHG